MRVPRVSNIVVKLIRPLPETIAQDGWEVSYTQDGRPWVENFVFFSEASAFVEGNLLDK